MTTYARDLDLNLLRVFVVVAETGSVTAAASRLYLTQPAVSAAVKRLTTSVGAALFARQGRGLVLTARGQRLLDIARPHLEALVSAAQSAEVFDLKESTRTIRIGLSDVNEGWLLPPLLRSLEREAPRLRLVVLPVQFRTVSQAFASGAIDLAVTVADDLPAGILRKELFRGGFVCVHDPRFSGLGRSTLTLARYLARRHVVVSYNGDLRGVVEDVIGVQRDVRISVPTFHAVGKVVSGTALLATLPVLVATQLLAEQPELAVLPLPFGFAGNGLELLSRASQADDPSVAWVIAQVERIAARVGAVVAQETKRRTRRTTRAEGSSFDR